MTANGRMGRSYGEGKEAGFVTGRSSLDEEIQMREY